MNRVAAAALLLALPGVRACGDHQPEPSRSTHPWRGRGHILLIIALVWVVVAALTLLAIRTTGEQLLRVRVEGMLVVGPAEAPAASVWVVAGLYRKSITSEAAKLATEEADPEVGLDGSWRRAGVGAARTNRAGRFHIAYLGTHPVSSSLLKNLVAGGRQPPHGFGVEGIVVLVPGMPVASIDPGLGEWRCTKAADGVFDISLNLGRVVVPSPPRAD